jgi:hypothetical protein
MMALLFVVVTCDDVDVDVDVSSDAVETLALVVETIVVETLGVATGDADTVDDTMSEAKVVAFDGAADVDVGQATPVQSGTLRKHSAGPCGTHVGWQRAFDSF